MFFTCQTVCDKMNVSFETKYIYRNINQTNMFTWSKHFGLSEESWHRACAKSRGQSLLCSTASHWWECFNFFAWHQMSDWLEANSLSFILYFWKITKYFWKSLHLMLRTGWYPESNLPMTKKSVCLNTTLSPSVPLCEEIMIKIMINVMIESVIKSVLEFHTLSFCTLLRGNDNLVTVLCDIVTMVKPVLTTKRAKSWTCSLERFSPACAQSSGCINISYIIAHIIHNVSYLVVPIGQHVLGELGSQLDHPHLQKI